MPVVALAFLLGGMWALGRLDAVSGAAAFGWLLVLLACIAGGVLLFIH